MHKLKQHKSRNSVFAYICGRNPGAKREIGILEELFSDLPLSRVDLGSARKMWIINKKSSCHKDGSKNGKGKKIVGWTAEKLFVILKDGDVFFSLSRFVAEKTRRSARLSKCPRFGLAASPSENYLFGDDT